MMLGLFAGKEGAMGEKLSWMIVGIVTVFLFQVVLRSSAWTEVVSDRSRY